MAKYRIIELPGYYYHKKVQKSIWGFLWVTVFTGPVEDCRHYIRQKKNPIIEEC